MKSSLLTLRVRRFRKEKDPPQWIGIFQVEIRKGMNLLEALLRIQDEQDGTLAFLILSGRFGSYEINGKVLACRTHAETFGKPLFIGPFTFGDSRPHCGYVSFSSAIKK
jgi:succinate dehydrogenase/fumarate reductase-like Fe-S protein